MLAGIRNGQPVRVGTFRTWFGAAAESIGGPDRHPHQLRHTAASLAIASGAEVKLVQQMLGHGSATMAPHTYGHLFVDRLDEVATAVDARWTPLARRLSSVAPTQERCLVLPPCCPRARSGSRGA